MEEASESEREKLDRDEERDRDEEATEADRPRLRLLSLSVSFSFLVSDSTAAVFCVDTAGADEAPTKLALLASIPASPVQ